ncbi:MAG: hypothetical protein LBF00_01885 [Mycoplasmataceae bacterium]|jgi:uncharacterized membrane protein|nr:hypothetical protein [Mycoplasmataceae bacterium]
MINKKIFKVKEIKTEMDYQRARNKRALWVVATYTGWFVGLVMFLCGIFIFLDLHMLNQRNSSGIGFLLGGIVLLLLSLPTFIKWRKTTTEMKKFRKGDYHGFERKPNDSSKIDYGKD